MARRKEDEQIVIDTVGPGELDLLLAGLPSDDAKVKLYRVKAQGTPAFIAEFSPRDFSEEAIRNTYGGGKYRYVAIENGVVAKQGNFEIEGEPKEPSKPVYKKYIQTSRGLKLVFSNPDDAEVILDSVTGEPVKNKPSLNTATTADPVMLLLLQEIRGLKEQLTRAPEHKTNKDMVAELLMYKELFSSPKQEPQSVEMSKMVVDLIQKGMEVASAAENGGSPWMSVLDKVLPTLDKAFSTLAISMQRAKVNQPVNGAIVVPQPQPQQVTAEPANIPATGFDSIADKLRAYLSTFLQAASSQTDPSILVDLTIPNIPESNKQIVIDWLESEQWFSDLLKLHPMIAGQQAWWTDYRNILLDYLKSPPGDLNEQETE